MGDKTGDMNMDESEMIATVAAMAQSLDGRVRPLENVISNAIIIPKSVVNSLLVALCTLAALVVAVAFMYFTRPI
ncbi:MAG: hypothetical protein KAJ03_01760 [Gammaproteobacteria bacterium]|nr:hypothetical protein [Gammaproteobacteria bacterium]